MSRESSLSLKLTFIVVVLGCTGLPLATFSFTFVPGTTYRFAYKTDTSLNQIPTSPSQSKPIRKDVGIKLHAIVEVTSIWSNDDDSHLVKLAANEVSLQGLAIEDSRKVEQLFKSPSFFLLEAGIVTKMFVNEEHRLSANMFRGVASLFQFGERSLESETDASGSCEVTYEKIGDRRLLKSKRNCHDQDSLEYTNANKLLGIKKRSWREVEYSFSDDFILSVKAQESHEVSAELGNVATTVSARQQLSLLESEASRVETISGSLEEAVGQMRKDFKKLVESSLKLNLDNADAKSSSKELRTSIEELRSKVVPSSIGQDGSSQAFLALLGAFRSANQGEMTKVLMKYKADDAIFPALIDVACATQTSHSLNSLREVLDFQRDNVQLLERFLLGAALSTRPSEELLLYLLDLSAMNLKDVQLKESVQEALGAVLNTYAKTRDHKTHVIEKVTNALLEYLYNCEDDPACQLVTIRALSNAGAWRTVEPIVRILESSTMATVGEACLKALRRFDIDLLDSEYRERLKEVFHQRRRGFDTVVRTQSLKLLLKMNLGVDEIRDMFLETLDPWNTDYGLYVQSLIFDEARKNPTFGKHLNEVLGDFALGNFHTLSPEGKSLAFSSEMLGSPKVEYMMYVENDRTGTMRRSGMDVDLRHFNSTLPLYKFELFAAGVGGLVGASTDESDGEEITAGMSLDMMGVSLRPITFFVGQGELLSAVWSAPSELMSALQINFLLHDHKESLLLSNGLHIKFEVTGVVSLDLSGSLIVSLWNKDAHSLVRNSGSLTLNSVARLETNLFQSTLESTEKLQSGIDFKTDVDFYDGVKMCLQMIRPDSLFRWQTIGRERLSGSRRSFLSRTRSKAEVPGISYPLPRSNYEKCRALFPG